MTPDPIAHGKLDRIEWKLDKLLRVWTRHALSSSTSGPTATTSPTATDTGAPKRITELVKEFTWPALKTISRWLGEKLVAYGATHIIPPLFGVWLLGRDGWGKLLAWVQSLPAWVAFLLP